MTERLTTATDDDDQNIDLDLRLDDLPNTGLLIGGSWNNGSRSQAVKDKYLNVDITSVTEATKEDVHNAVVHARNAFDADRITPYDMATVFRRAIELIEAARWRFVRLMIAEAGFTLADAAGEVNRAKVTLGLCAEETTRVVGDMVPFAASPGQHRRLGYTLRVPIGIVCAITPFNSPLNTVLHKIGPALGAGNSVILKPSMLTPLTAALLCETLIDAGLPPRLLSLVHGEGNPVGEALLSATDIGFYAFTGSSSVGRIIKRGAGLRRTQLELGSIASTIVCKDANLEQTIPKVVNAGYRKAGQVCTSVQRLYVDESILPEVLERLEGGIAAFPAGNPRLASTRVGPMISESAAQRTQDWVDEARASGARVRAGGAKDGSVFQPTLLTEVTSGMRVVSQEVFAPVVSVIPFTNFHEAIKSANDTPYGLSAGVFTQNLGMARDAMLGLRFGTVQINETSSARGDAMPFGGVKDSGHGHEGPRFALREFTEQRLIVLNP